MANKDDYLNNYRKFFEYFAQTVNPNDQLPVKLGSYKILNLEVVGGIIDWTSQYLSQKKCPEHLVAPLIKIVIEEIRKGCKKQPINYGFNSSDNAYEPLKLMQAVMAKINEVCLRYLDNSMLCSLPAPTNVFYETSICARRNRRRRMEDRHVVIHDLNTMFNIQETSPSSYFAIFDGHAGHDAASYSAAHLHQYLTENKYFASNLEQALKDAFCKTDALFLEKCNVESLTGGTTAVVALLRPKEKSLYIAWVGDSQALLVKQGKILQCVNPHKPCREDERARIEQAGGCVMHWGTWRVNGQLAVSRAIGDADYKPHVTAIPDVKEIALDGDEDFLIIACDGLWDYLSEDAAAHEVYYMIAEHSDDTERVSKHLVQLACYQGSTDNISVIVVFLRDPHQIAAEAPRWANKNGPTLTASNMEAGLDNANNPFTNSNGSLKNLDVVDADNINLQKSANDGLLLNLTDNFKANGTDLSKDIFGTEKSNGTKKSVSEAPFDDDFGPETNVDDLLSPIEKEKAFTESLVKGLHGDDNLGSLHSNEAKSVAEGLVNNNPFDDTFNPFSNNPLMKENNETKEFDFEEFCSENREETPTPPAEEVHDGGLEVNPTESDSEDEWNYIKGDQANPETISLQPETVVEASESDDAMSQLNPNAAEFVPVSPTRSVPSPSCHNLLKEEVLSQSPKRPQKMDFSKVPSENEFESEVKSRPSDFDKNGFDSDLDVSIGDKIEGLLNGKNIDEIPEFLPGSTPAKPSDEFHFGPNAAPFTPKVFDQSEVSTKAEYGDDTAQLNASFDSELTLPKEEDDPMSMSFYAEKGEANPFENEHDLNKVHKVPDNLDDFLGDFDNKENAGFNETISDLPEHDPLGLPLDNDAAAVQTTDLDKLSQDDEKELASPLDAPSEPVDSNVNSESVEVNTSKECDDVAAKLQYVENELEKGTTERLVSSPQPELQLENVETELQKEVNEVEFLSPQPDLTSSTVEPLAVSPAPEAISPIPDPKLIYSAAGEKSDLLNIDEVASNSLSETDDIPVLSSNEELVPESQPLSEQVVLTAEPEQFLHDLCAPAVALNVTEEEYSPKCAVDFLSTEKPDILDDITAASVPKCEYSTEPELCALPVQAPPSPVDLIQEIKQEEEVTSSVKDDVSSPVEQISHSSVFDDSVKEDIVIGACELRQPLVEFQAPVPSLPVEHPSQSEINDFEPSAPVESSFNGLDNYVSEPNEQICIKTDSIIPEFAEPAILTPSEESKAVDDVNAPSPLPSHAEISLDTLQEPPQPESLLTSQTVVSPESSVFEIIPSEEVIIPEVEVVQTVQANADAELPLETVAVATSDKVKKKPIGKVEPRKFTSPSPRAGTAKPSTKSPINASKSGVTTKIPPKAAPSKAIGAAPKPTSAVSSRPLPKPKTATTKPTETTKPATANLKAVPKTLTRKTPTDPPVTKTFTRPIGTAAKTSPAKLPAARPNTAPRSLPTKPAVSAVPAKAPAAPKPRVPLSSRTATTTTVASKTTTSAIAKSTTTTSKTLTSPKPTPASPKPRTFTSVTAKPRVPLCKTATKSADVEKEKKESANKLTASRTTTVTKTASSNHAGRTTNATMKKAETKLLSDRTVVSRTSTTTKTVALSKRPADLKTISKTKTTKIEKPKENGVAPASVTEEITIVNNVVNQAGTETLVKDNSPLDNKLLIETSNSLIDTTPAD